MENVKMMSIFDFFKILTLIRDDFYPLIRAKGSKIKICSTEHGDGNADELSMEEDVDFINIVPFLIEPSYTEEELEVREQVASLSCQNGRPETDCCLCGICTFLQNEPVTK